jgi:hypothetical protein
LPARSRSSCARCDAPLSLVGTIITLRRTTRAEDWPQASRSTVELSLRNHRAASLRRGVRKAVGGSLGSQCVAEGAARYSGVRWRLVASIVIGITVLSIGAIAVAATRHTPECRGSATYGIDFARCGGPSSPATTKHPGPGYAEYTYEPCDVHASSTTQTGPMGALLCTHSSTGASPPGKGQP